MNQKDIAHILSLNAYQWLEKAYNLARNEEYSFVERWTAEQWLTITRAWRLCEYDFMPSRWSKEQVNDVLIRGLVPAFKEVKESDIPDSYSSDPYDIDDRRLWRRLEGFLPDEPVLRLDGRRVDR